MAGVSFWRLYFRFFNGAIKGPLNRPGFSGELRV
jgi:hypothetical protein